MITAVLSHSLMIRFFHLSRCLVANNAIMIIVAVTRHDTTSTQKAVVIKSPKDRGDMCIFVSFPHFMNNINESRV